MRSWVLLLLLAALSAARLPLGSAEGDPLPPSLIDLVRNSPISSVDDLKLLLQQKTNAIEEEEEGEEEDTLDALTNHSRGRYTRSLVEAQPAQQAACKVRTEVMEVTRSMLDRRNANFMLWPPCVEVQRCSGCCNTRTLKCVPVTTSSRYLQVIKIQYINRKAQYDKAIITVEDHVSCRCQPLSSSVSSRQPNVHSSTQSNPKPALPQQPPLSSHLSLPLPRSIPPTSLKTHVSKADLHRHDDLKHNQQRYDSEEHEPVPRQWQQGSYTQLVHWTQPRLHQTPTHVQSGVQQVVLGVLERVSSWPSEAKAEHSVMGSTQQLVHGSGYDGSKDESSTRGGNSDGELHHTDHMQRQQELLHHQQKQHLHQQHENHHQQNSPHQFSRGTLEDRELSTQQNLNAPQSENAFPPINATQPTITQQKTTHPLTTSQKDSVSTPKSSEVINHTQTETKTTSQNEEHERAESGSSISKDTAEAELGDHGKEKDSKLTSGNGYLTEQERRQQILETVQRELDRETQVHPQHPQQSLSPTTFKTVLSTVAPILPSARKVPFRPASPRRRRKHRKRISKAAIRAMIM